MVEGASVQRVAILGSTGSIGTSCLSVLRAHAARFAPFVLTAHRKWRELAAQCREFLPRIAVLTGVSADEIDRSEFPASVDLRFGPEAVSEVAAHPEVDTVVSGIVGAAGLRGTWSALEAGKRVAFANKETLVVAGPLVMDLVQRSGATLLPVDSEHNAIFQAMQSGRRDEVRRVILTASGGPFREWSAEQIESVTIEQALAHPTWEMGPKITIDSATMMNKALEIIEARWLFDLRVDQIEVVVHPDSIIHSMVEFADGSVISQMSPPDMRLPIQFALSWPERLEAVSPRMDFTRALKLQFEPPDPERFPALKLGFEVAEQGGTAGAVLNAANEVAVERFLQKGLGFTDIPRLCRSVLEAHTFDSEPTLDELLRLDGWARQEAFRW